MWFQCPCFRTGRAKVDTRQADCPEGQRSIFRTEVLRPSGSCLRVWLLRLQRLFHQRKEDSPPIRAPASGETPEPRRPDRHGGSPPDGLEPPIRPPQAACRSPGEPFPPAWSSELPRKGTPLTCAGMQGTDACHQGSRKLAPIPLSDGSQQPNQSDSETHSGGEKLEHVHRGITGEAGTAGYRRQADDPDDEGDHGRGDRAFRRGCSIFSLDARVYRETRPGPAPVMKNSLVGAAFEKLRR